MEFILKFSAILSIFYVFYKIFLQRETFFNANRVFFIFGIISAAAIPFIIIPEYIETQSILLPANTSTSLISTRTTANMFDWLDLLSAIYIVGVIGFSIRFIVQMSNLFYFLTKSKKVKEGKFFFITSSKNHTPFSFFNFIVYNPLQFKTNELQQVLTHEKIHANQLHSVDTIFFQLIVILNWFNPIIWLYNKEVQKNLEFLADAFAKNQKIEKKNYQYLLLKTISTNYQLAITNNFYNSLIKNRIKMLQKNQSKKIMYLKYILIIPMLIAFIFTFNTKVIAQQKKMYTVTVETDPVDYYETIDKNFTKADFEKLKTRLASKGIALKYSKLKYNSNNEITAIELRVKNDKGNQAKIYQKESGPISSIQIKINKKTGDISLGNIHELHKSDVFYAPKGDKAMHKKIIIKEGTGGQGMSWSSNDSTKVIDLQEDNSFVFISDDNTTTLSMGNDKKNTYTYKIKRVGGGGDIRIGSKSSNTWISKDGDSTKLKKIKVIEIDEDSDGPHKVMIKSSDNGDKHDIFVVKSDDKVHANHDNMVFIDSDGKKPLFIVDGKEVENGKFEDINPNEIEKMNVLKGPNAIEKYGEKAKNGVVEITTKK